MARVGIGEGRPDSKASAGLGNGLFQIVNFNGMAWNRRHGAAGEALRRGANAARCVEVTSRLAGVASRRGRARLGRIRRRG